MSDDSKVDLAYLLSIGEWQECVQIGEPAVAPLIAILKDEHNDVRVRLAAATVLGHIGDVRAVEPIATIFQDVEYLPEIRHVAAKALATIGPTGIKVLIDALKEEKTAISAAFVLGDHKILQAIEPLIAALKGENIVLRSFAAKALGKIGDTRAVEPLIAALEDEFVRESAAEGLYSITGQELGADPNKWKMWRETRR